MVKFPTILMVDDDDEDIYLTERGFRSHIENLVFKSVHSGSEMFDYLQCKGKFTENTHHDLPDILLLDINIPRENGLEVLKQLKMNERHNHIPVCILTTSSAQHDVREAYQLGASSYICKSVNPDDMKKTAAHFCKYWFDFVKLPLNI